MGEHHHVHVVWLEADQIQPVNEQILFREARQRVVAQEARHRARREPRVEQDHRARGAHEPARDRNPHAIPRKLVVKEPRPLEAYEPVLQRVKPEDRHLAHHSTGPERVARNGRYATIPHMDFQLTEQQELIRKEVATLARSFSLDYWLEKDRKAEYPTDWIRAFAQAGWLGMIIPEEYSRSGLGVAQAAPTPQQACAAGAGTTGASPIHFYMFPPMPVIKHGSEDLKRRYLPRIAAGEIVMSFGVTEPNAGTDTSRIQTGAERRGDGYVVNGRKVWNTNAQHATHILLLARTAPRDAARPFADMTLFFTEFDRAKITVREIEKLGRAAVDSN